MVYLSQEITTITSTNLTEATTAWNSATSYAAGDYALFDTYVYKSVASHSNKSPADYTGIYWVKWSISNKWASLDLSSQSKSSVTGADLTITFPQNRMKTLAIGNYEAASILIEILASDGTTVLWSYDLEDTIYNNVVDWWTWTFSDYVYEVDRAIKIELGRTDGSFVRVTFIKSPSSTVSSCGFLLGGNVVYMGCTLNGINFNFNSYATKESDPFGTLNIIKRAVQDKVDFNTIIENNRLMTSKRNIKSVYNDIIAFIVDERDDSPFENMITLGVIESANVVLDDGEYTTLSWSILEAL